MSYMQNWGIWYTYIYLAAVDYQYLYQTKLHNTVILNEKLGLIFFQYMIDISVEYKFKITNL